MSWKDEKNRFFGWNYQFNYHIEGFLSKKIYSRNEFYNISSKVTGLNDAISSAQMHIKVAEEQMYQPESSR